MSTRPNRALMVAGLIGVSLVSLVAQQRPADPPGQARPQVPADDGVPSDLRPLLQPRRSELRLIVQHYNADRLTLSGNYQGAQRRPGRRPRWAAGCERASSARFALARIASPA